MLADYTDQEIALRNVIKRETFYPKLVLIMSMVIILGASFAARVFFSVSIGLSSPLTEPITWVFLGPLIVGIFLFLRVGLANPRVKYNWDAFILAMPLGIGKTVREFCMAK